MTTVQLLNQYGIKFLIYESPKTIMGSKRIRKAFLGGGSMENYFGSDFNTPESIIEDVLPIIQHYINGNDPAMDPISSELGGSVDYAIPNLNQVVFHNPHNGEITQIIPITDFKGIAEAWKEFLLKRPFENDPV